MTNTKYYVSGDGVYVGAFCGVKPPEGVVEVPSAPQDARDVWQFPGWGTTGRVAVQALAAVNVGAAQALARLSAAYPDGEVQSWAQQTREAEALAADPQAPAPLLSAIAAARGLEVAELASRVLAKVQAYAVASGQIIGQRQALEDAINAVDLAAPNAAEQLAAIQWPGASS